MQIIRKTWRQLSFIGCEDNLENDLHLKIRVSNQVSIILLPLLVISIWMELSLSDYYNVAGFVLFLILCLGVLVLNHLHRYNVSRYLLTLLPPFIILIPILMSGVERGENYLGLSYTFVGLAVLPILLLNPVKEKILYWISLGIYIVFILFFDRWLSMAVRVPTDVSFIYDHYLFYKLPQLLLAVVILGTLKILRDSYFDTQKRLLSSNNELLESHHEIQARNEEIRAQNDALNEKQQKIEDQFQKLQNYNHELLATKKELLKNIDQLSKANQLISFKEAESRSVLDVLKRNFLVLEMDLEGRINWINSNFEATKSRASETLIGKNISFLLGLEEKEKMNSGSLEVLHQSWTDLLNGTRFAMESEVKALSDGNSRYSIIFAPILNEKGKVDRVLAIGQDVTKLSEQRAQIEQINEQLNSKITEIEQQNALLNFQQTEIFEKNEILLKQKEEIQAINESLEERVKERTIILEKKNRQLAEYAHINSHILRAPVSTMMGLLNLMKYQEFEGEEKRLFELLSETAQHLDDIIEKINTAVETGYHFDRDYLDKKTSIAPR